MPEALIQKLSEVKDRARVISEMEEIFFESSAKKDFKDQAERDQFREKYFGYYLRNYLDFVWVAVSDHVLGYVLVSPQSSEPELLKIQPHLLKFQNELLEYPAHLHINLHADSRGLGVGSKLLKESIGEVRFMGLKGLHIMTGASSRNASFYKRLGFTFTVEKSSILFMGLPL